jgi:hypothetical protein
MTFHEVSKYLNTAFFPSFDVNDEPSDGSILGGVFACILKLLTP